MDEGIPSSDYQVTRLASFFHGFPHLDLSFQEVNSTFNPEDESYREGLSFWTGIPVLWCLVVWVGFLFFFCVRWCRKSQRKQSRSSCSRCSAGLFLLFGCGALAVSFYGNAVTHSGVEEFVHNVKVVNKTVKTGVNVVSLLDRLAERVHNKRIPALAEAVAGISNATVHKQVSELIQKLNSSIDTVRQDVASVRSDALHVNTQILTDQAEQLESYRWTATILVFCVYIFLFLFFFAGLLKKTKWMLIVPAVLSLVMMVVICCGSSFYLALSIASGDLCVDPDQFVLSRVNGTLRQDVLLAYIKCEDKTKPYSEQIQDAQSAVTQASLFLNTTVNMSLPFNISHKLAAPVKNLRSDFTYALGNLSSLASLLGSCDNVHGEYIDVIKSVCDATLSGLGYEVLFTLLLGLCVAVIVLCSALAWPHLNRRRGRSRAGYREVDDSDPFLPDPPPYPHTYGSTSAATLAKVSGPRNPDMAINRDDGPIMNQAAAADSPPPAYQPGHIMQQYHNLAPTPTSIVQSSQNAA